MNLDRILNQLIENEVFTVILTGGEPLLNREGFQYAVDKLKANNTDTYINTNLSLDLDSETLKRLSQMNLVLVPFPSYDEKLFNSTVNKDSYKKVLRNLELLAESGIQTGINQVVTKRNKDHVQQTAMFLYERFKDLKVFSATPVVAVRKEDKGYELDRQEILKVGEDLIKVHEDTGLKVDMLTCIPPCFFPEKMMDYPMSMHGCSAGMDLAVVGSDGSVRRCTKLEKSYGNLLQEDLARVWKRITSFEKTKNSLCDECFSPYGCYGGCEMRVAVDRTDHLIKGKEHLHLSKARQMVSGKEYFIEKIKFRPEGNGFLISNGPFVHGNSHLVNFMDSLQGKTFTLERIQEEYGQIGVNIINYLYNKNLVRDAV
jgi:radical SAM protein with 4Fe4S-binding SPASM domain